MIERFAVPDQLNCYYDGPAEPANVHVEVRVPGMLDESVLRGAVQAVLASEPGVRARRAPAGGWRRSYYWEYPPVPDVDPVRVAAPGDRAGLDAQRDAFLSQALPLDVSPPLRFLLASGTGGDCLILNAHHARFDGLSCLRLLRMVADEYGRLERRSHPAASPVDPWHQAASGPTCPGSPPSPRGCSPGRSPATCSARWRGRPGMPRNTPDRRSTWHRACWPGRRSRSRPSTWSCGRHCGSRVRCSAIPH